MSLRSAAHLGGVRFRPYEDAPFAISATIAIPAGRALATADRLRFFAFGAGTQVQELNIRASDLDTGTTLAFNVGFESHNVPAQASNLTAYASGNTVGRDAGMVRIEPTAAAPVANYTLTLSPSAAGTGNSAGGSITVSAVLAPFDLPSGILGNTLGNAYDHGRANPGF